jgi:glycine/D-amino acid oxidase-like deaminating enzyme
LALDAFDDLVVGGGFFGCSLARRLRRENRARVVVLDAGSGLLRRASYANQARVHRGYHYPRSLLTALRSRINYPRFLEEFGDCVDRSFDSYYAVSRVFSKVTAAQFRSFCERIGAPIAPAPPGVRRWFDANLVEEVFAVEECAFDAVKLQQKMAGLLEQAGVEVRLECEASSVRRLDDSRIEVVCRDPTGERVVTARRVFNCTYSRLNRLLVASGIPMVPLKHELTEIALIEVPDELRHVGITMMCGPFFSAIPFPARGLHSLSHVRYTPHFHWEDAPGRAYVDPQEVLRTFSRKSNFVRMRNDAARFVKLLSSCRQVDSIFEVKTVLPRSEIDDGRPILSRAIEGIPNLHCVLGAKIDNVYDVIDGMTEPETTPQWEMAG